MASGYGKIKASFCFKVVTLITLITFTFSELSIAQTIDVYRIHVPQQAGVVKERWTPERETSFVKREAQEKNASRDTLHEIHPLIIHIQDAHTSLEAQHNIAKIIEHLKNNFGVTAVALEGGRVGKLDISMFRRHPDRAVREMITDYYLREGELTGAEQAAAVSQSSIQLLGAENQALYNENLKAFLAVTQKREPFLNQIISDRASLEELLLKKTSEPLRSFVQKIKRFESDQLSFADFLSELFKQSQLLQIDVLRFPNLSVLIESAQNEKLDVKKLNLTDPIQMMQEARSLQNEVALKLAQTPEEKNQIRKLSHLTLLKSILELKALGGEVEEFRKEFVGSRQAAVGSEEKDKAADWRLPSADLIQQALKFYELAEKRNHAMIENVLAQAKTRPDPNAPIVIVAGGYHTTGLTEILRQKKYPYIVITPQVTNSQNSLPYLDRMLGKKSNYEKMVETSYSTLAHALLSAVDGAAKEGLIYRVAVDTRAVSLAQALSLQKSDGTTLRCKVSDFNPAKQKEAERAFQELRTFVNSMQVAVDQQGRLVILTEEEGRQTARYLDGNTFTGGSFELPTSQQQAVDLPTLLEKLKAVWMMTSDEAAAWRGAFRPQAVRPDDDMDEGDVPDDPRPLPVRRAPRRTPSRRPFVVPPSPADPSRRRPDVPDNGDLDDLIHGKSSATTVATTTSTPAGAGVSVRNGSVGGSGVTQNGSGSTTPPAPPSGFESGDGFDGQFLKVIQAVAQVSPHVRSILEADTDFEAPKEDVVMLSIANALSNSGVVQSVESMDGILNKRVPSVSQGYRVILSQENYDLVRKSNLSIGTLMGVYEGERLVGSISILNGPITTMVVADGTRIANYAYDGKKFVKREKVLNLNQPNTDEKSPAALGGLLTQWPQMFHNFFWKNKRSIPGFGEVDDIDKKTKKVIGKKPAPNLKTRYSGVDGQPAIGANLYEVLVNNGFFSEIVTPQEARILSQIITSAGGAVRVMTRHGLRTIDQMPIEEPSVQFYGGNPGVMDKLIQDPEIANATNVDLPSAARAPPRLVDHDETYYDSRIALGAFLRQNLLGTRPSQINQDLANALKGIESVACQVPHLYVTGGRATGEIDSGGAAQAEIDEQTDELFGKALKPYVWAYHSEELDLNYEDGQGQYLAYFGDPLDGSSKVESNGGGGTIGAFLEVPKGSPLTDGTVKASDTMYASFFITYGVQTRLVLAIKGKGVNEFVLRDGQFYFERNIDFSKVERDSQKGLRAATGGSRSDWAAGFAEKTDQWLQAGASNGYGGAMVTDVYGVINYILDGGRAVFSYFGQKLRVKYEEAPMAFIFEQAGGASLTYDAVKDGKISYTTRIRSVLDRFFTSERNADGKFDTKCHQKEPVAIGDQETIDEIRASLLPSPEPTTTPANPAVAGGRNDCSFSLENVRDIPANILRKYSKKQEFKPTLKNTRAVPREAVERLIRIIGHSETPFQHQAAIVRLLKQMAKENRILLKPHLPGSLRSQRMRNGKVYLLVDESFEFLFKQNDPTWDVFFAAKFVHEATEILLELSPEVQWRLGHLDPHLPYTEAMAYLNELRFLENFDGFYENLEMKIKKSSFGNSPLFLLYGHALEGVFRHRRPFNNIDQWFQLEPQVMVSFLQQLGYLSEREDKRRFINPLWNAVLRFDRQLDRLETISLNRLERRVRNLYRAEQSRRRRFQYEKEDLLSFDYELVRYSEGQKLNPSLDQDNRPILVVGEGASQYEDGRTFEVIKSQLERSFRDVSKKDIHKITICYASPLNSISDVQINAVCRVIRAFVLEHYGLRAASKIPILVMDEDYSERPLLQQPNVDGLMRVTPVGKTRPIQAIFVRTPKQARVAKMKLTHRSVAGRDADRELTSSDPNEAIFLGLILERVPAEHRFRWENLIQQAYKRYLQTDEGKAHQQDSISVYYAAVLGFIMALSGLNQTAAREHLLRLGLLSEWVDEISQFQRSSSTSTRPERPAEMRARFDRRDASDHFRILEIILNRVPTDKHEEYRAKLLAAASVATISVTSRDARPSLTTVFLGMLEAMRFGDEEKLTHAYHLSEEITQVLIRGHEVISAEEQAKSSVVLMFGIPNHSLSGNLQLYIETFSPDWHTRHLTPAELVDLIRQATRGQETRRAIESAIQELRSSRNRKMVNYAAAFLMAMPDSSLQPHAHEIAGILMTRRQSHFFNPDTPIFKLAIGLIKRLRPSDAVEFEAASVHGTSQETVSVHTAPPKPFQSQVISATPSADGRTTAFLHTTADGWGAYSIMFNPGVSSETEPAAVAPALAESWDQTLGQWETPTPVPAPDEKVIAGTTFSSPATARVRILVVDDNEDYCQATARLLKAYGYEVQTASSGHEALRILETEESFHLVITDYQMPNMNGMELTRQIKSNPRLQSIPVVLNSGYLSTRPDDPLIILAKEAGVARVISKPYAGKLDLLINEVLRESTGSHLNEYFSESGITKILSGSFAITVLSSLVGGLLPWYANQNYSFLFQRHYLLLASEILVGLTFVVSLLILAGAVWWYKRFESRAVSGVSPPVSLEEIDRLRPRTLFSLAQIESATLPEGRLAQAASDLIVRVDLKQVSRLVQGLPQAERDFILGSIIDHEKFHLNYPATSLIGFALHAFIYSYQMLTTARFAWSRRAPINPPLWQWPFIGILIGISYVMPALTQITMIPGYLYGLIVILGMGAVSMVGEAWQARLFASSQNLVSTSRRPEKKSDQDQEIETRIKMHLFTVVVMAVFTVVVACISLPGTRLNAFVYFSSISVATLFLVGLISRSYAREKEPWWELPLSITVGPFLTLVALFGGLTEGWRRSSRRASEKSTPSRREPSEVVLRDKKWPSGLKTLLVGLIPTAGILLARSRMSSAPGFAQIAADATSRTASFNVSSLLISIAVGIVLGYLATKAANRLIAYLDDSSMSTLLRFQVESGKNRKEVIANAKYNVFALLVTTFGASIALLLLFSALVVSCVPWQFLSPLILQASLIGALIGFLLHTVRNIFFDLWPELKNLIHAPRLEVIANVEKTDHRLAITYSDDTTRILIDDPKKTIEDIFQSPDHRSVVVRFYTTESTDTGEKRVYHFLILLAGETEPTLFSSGGEGEIDILNRPVCFSADGLAVAFVANKTHASSRGPVVWVKSALQPLRCVFPDVSTESRRLNNLLIGHIHFVGPIDDKTIVIEYQENEKHQTPQHIRIDTASQEELLAHHGTNPAVGDSAGKSLAIARVFLIGLITTAAALWTAGRMSNAPGFAQVAADAASQTSFSDNVIGILIIVAIGAMLGSGVSFVINGFYSSIHYARRDPKELGRYHSYGVLIHMAIVMLFATHLFNGSSPIGLVEKVVYLAYFISYPITYLITDYKMARAHSFSAFFGWVFKNKTPLRDEKNYLISHAMTVQEALSALNIRYQHAMQVITVQRTEDRAIKTYVLAEPDVKPEDVTRFPLQAGDNLTVAPRADVITNVISKERNEWPSGSLKNKRYRGSYVSLWFADYFTTGSYEEMNGAPHRREGDVVVRGIYNEDKAIHLGDILLSHNRRAVAVPYQNTENHWCVKTKLVGERRMNMPFGFQVHSSGPFKNIGPVAFDPWGRFVAFAYEDFSGDWHICARASHCQLIDLVELPAWKHPPNSLQIDETGMLTVNFDSDLDHGRFSQRFNVNLKPLFSPLQRFQRFLSQKFSLDGLNESIFLWAVLAAGVLSALAEGLFHRVGAEEIAQVAADAASQASAGGFAEVAFITGFISAGILVAAFFSFLINAPYLKVTSASEEPSKQIRPSIIIWGPIMWFVALFFGHLTLRETASSEFLRVIALSALSISYLIGFLATDYFMARKGSISHYFGWLPRKKMDWDAFFSHDGWQAMTRTLSAWWVGIVPLGAAWWAVGRMSNAPGFAQIAADAASQTSFTFEAISIFIIVAIGIVVGSGFSYVINRFYSDIDATHDTDRNPRELSPFHSCAVIIYVIFGMLLATDLFKSSTPMRLVEWAVYLGYLSSGTISYLITDYLMGRAHSVSAYLGWLPRKKIDWDEKFSRIGWQAMTNRLLGLLVAATGASALVGMIEGSVHNAGAVEITGQLMQHASAVSPWWSFAALGAFAIAGVAVYQASSQGSRGYYKPRSYGIGPRGRRGRDDRGKDIRRERHPRGRSQRPQKEPILPSKGSDEEPQKTSGATEPLFQIESKPEMVLPGLGELQGFNHNNLILIDVDPILASGKTTLAQLNFVQEQLPQASNIAHLVLFSRTRSVVDIQSELEKLAGITDINLQPILSRVTLVSASTLSRVVKQVVGDVKPRSFGALVANSEDLNVITQEFGSYASIMDQSSITDLLKAALAQNQPDIHFSLIHTQVAALVTALEHQQSNLNLSNSLTALVSYDLKKLQQSGLLEGLRGHEERRVMVESAA